MTLDALEDVSAAGEVDLLVQTRSSGGGPVRLELMHEVDAEPAWSVELLPRFGSMSFEPEAGDVTGDERKEILLQRYLNRRLLALDGATGKTVWSAEGILESTVSGSSGADLLFIDGDASEGYAEIEITRASPRRGPLWTATVDVSGRTEGWPLYGGSAWPAGDATGDGVVDVGVQVMLFDDWGERAPLKASRQLLLDGRTGRTLASGAGYFPLAGSVTASGTDAIEFRRERGDVDLLGRDGASGDVLWRTPLPDAHGWPPCSWAPQTLRTQEGADLVLVELPTSEGDDELLVDGATGEVLWDV